MKKTFCVLSLAVLVLGVMLVAFAPVNLNAGDIICTHANGDTCVGECCKVFKDGCLAGPCSYLFPK